MASNNSTAPSTSTPEYDPDMLARLLKNRRVRTMVDGQDGTPDDEALTAALQGLTIIDDKEHPELANSMKETMQLIMDMTHGDQDFNPEKLQEIQTKMAETFSSQLEKLSPEEQKQLEPLQSMLSPDSTAEIMNAPLVFTLTPTGDEEQDKENAKISEMMQDMMSQLSTVIGIDLFQDGTPISMKDMLTNLHSDEVQSKMRGRAALNAAIADQLSEDSNAECEFTEISADDVDKTKLESIITSLKALVDLTKSEDDKDAFFKEFTTRKQRFESTLFSIQEEEEDKPSKFSHLCYLTHTFFYQLVGAEYFYNNSDKLSKEALEACTDEVAHAKTILAQGITTLTALQFELSTLELAEDNVDLD